MAERLFSPYSHRALDEEVWIEHTESEYSLESSPPATLTYYGCRPLESALARAIAAWPMPTGPYGQFRPARLGPSWIGTDIFRMRFSRVAI